MPTIILTVDNEGKIALSLWLRQKLGIEINSQVTVIIEKEISVKADEKPTITMKFL